MIVDDMGNERFRWGESRDFSSVLNQQPATDEA